MGTIAQRTLISLLVTAMLFISACNKKETPASSTVATAPAPTTQSAPAVPAPAITQASWAPDALEELLAPIALYPDQLLSQILAASVNSQEVLDGGNWLLQNQNLQGTALDAAAQKVGFGAAMRALLQFPTVVDMLCQQIDWTRQVGSAFTSDQKGVLDAVQRLRAQAAAVGNLQSTPQQTVETRTENNQTIVEVKPADPQIVYVPQYNPQVVYTTPPPAAAAQPAATTTTTTDDPNTVSTGTAVAGGLLAFGAGILIGNAMDDDDDDCCYPNWGHSTVVVGARPFYPPAYAYRPAYSSGFRPAYGYNSPPGYRYNSNSGNINNININNKDYYNRFSKNQNLRAGSAQSPLSGATQNRYAQAGNNRADGWKGQSSYQGARNDASAARMNQAAGGRVGTPNASTRVNQTNTRYAGSNSTRPADASGARAPAAQDRQARAPQSTRSAHTDRGYADASQVANREASPQRPAQSLPDTQKASRDSAFSGATPDSGSFDRAASARGRASAGGRGDGAQRGGNRGNRGR